MGQSRKKGVFGIPNWEETQNPLERLYSLSDLEMPRDHSGGTGKCGWGEGCLKYTALPAATTTRLQIMIR